MVRVGATFSSGFLCASFKKVVRSSLIFFYINGGPRSLSSALSILLHIDFLIIYLTFQLDFSLLENLFDPFST